MKSKMLENQL